ncbi:MAG TPA: 2-dehydropantoate 2-reductase [Solirubrobacteraceae bacterium]|jgi:2-dehydropantoate 2-reductase
MTSIAVLGPGGVGGFIAGALTRAGEEVTVLARESTAQVLARDGLHIQSVILGEFDARPAAVTQLAEPVDVLIIATKAVSLDAALQRVQATPGLVVPLLNGLDHMQLLRRRFPAERVAAGTIRIEADRPEPGRIVHTSRFLQVDLASEHAEAAPALERLAGRLNRAEVPARIGPSEAQILWSKLVRLNALALTTSASAERLGFIRSDPVWREALLGCLREGAAVARADGAELDPAKPLGELEAAHAELNSSMQRDVAAGREPELDAIAGSVLRAARRHGLACPTIERLSGEVARRAGIEPPRV